MSLPKKLKVSHIDASASESAPVIACFPQGPPGRGFLDASSGDAMSFTMHMTEKAKRKNLPRYTLAATNSRVSYTAKNYGDGVDRNVAKFCVGILDKRKRTLSISSSTPVFALRQPMAGGGGVGTDSSMDERGRRKMLINEFGSRMKQKQQRSREANAVDAGQVAGASAVASALADDVTMEGQEGESGSARGAGGSASDDALMTLRRTLLPPFNAHASDASAVYPLDSLVPPSVGKGLAGSVNELFKAIKKPSTVEEVCKAHRLGYYATKRMQAWAEGGSSMEKAELKAKIRVLVLLQCYLKVIRQNRALRLSAPKDVKPEEEGVEGDGGDAASAGVVGGGEEEDSGNPSMPGPLRWMPESVGAHILGKFYTRHADARAHGGYKWMRDGQGETRLYLHAVVCAGHVEGWNMRLNPLAKELKMPVKKLRQYFQEAGFSVTVDKNATSKAQEAVKSRGGAGKVENVYRATLPTPVTFPNPKRGPRK